MKVTTLAMNRASEPTDPAAVLRNKAMRLLARREYSRHELHSRLMQTGADEALVIALLDQLAQRGWLSDQRFSEQLLRARSGQFGSRRIRYELREKGVDESTINATMAEAPQADYSVAKALWLKKFGQPAQDEKEKAKQVRFLQARGFGFEIIRKIIRGLDE